MYSFLSQLLNYFWLYLEAYDSTPYQTLLVATHICQSNVTSLIIKLSCISLMQNVFLEVAHQGPPCRCIENTLQTLGIDGS